MRQVITISVLLLSLRVFSQTAPANFIPQSPLTPKESADLTEKFKRDTSLTDAQIEDMLKDQSTYHSYRESDIVAVYPELRGDKKLSSCSNSMMSGATELVFISNVHKNEVTVKTVRCNPVKGGLSCGAAERGQYYFLESPERFFSLENLTFGKAKTILEAYQANRISGFPDWFGPPLREVRAVKALPDGTYQILFGDFFCAGCAGSFNVRLETSGSELHLVVVGQPELNCF